MANYNSGVKYNHTPDEGGALYNSAPYVYTIRLFEKIKTKDNSKNLLVRNVLFERTKFDDVIDYRVNHKHTDKMSFKDKSYQFALFDVAENLNIKDNIENLLVSLYIKDNFNIIDDMKDFSITLALKEKMRMNQINSLQALIELAEECGYHDLAYLFANIEVFDYARFTDKAPRKAVSDFFIGFVDDRDRAFKWLLPFDLFVDEDGTQLQVMPQTESTYIDMPGVDGSIIQNTIYKNRIFNIVAWSQDGLTTAEKEQLKYDIAQILDSTKETTKKLTFEKTGTSFDVKYSGNLDIREAPSFIKATIPLEASPYGYPLFDTIINGNGLLVNDGDADIGFVNVISAGCVNPSFKIGTILYTWNGTVPENHTLYIDHENYSCYLESIEKVRTNVLDKLTGEFQKIKKGTSIAITSLGDTEKYLKTILKEKRLW